MKQKISGSFVYWGMGVLIVLFTAQMSILTISYILEKNQGLEAILTYGIMIALWLCLLAVYTGKNYFFR